MENIKAFLDAVELYGLAKEDTFVTVDLFEGRNITQVVLGRKVYYKTGSMESLFFALWHEKYLFPVKKHFLFRQNVKDIPRNFK